MQQWQTVSVDLSPYKGQPISLAFEFDTYDTLFNVTKGVFIDRMRVLGCNE
jgi:hypothetical protein